MRDEADKVLRRSYWLNMNEAPSSGLPWNLVFLTTVVSVLANLVSHLRPVLWRQFVATKQDFACNYITVQVI